MTERFLNADEAKDDVDEEGFSEFLPEHLSLQFFFIHPSNPRHPRSKKNQDLSSYDDQVFFLVECPCLK